LISKGNKIERNDINFAEFVQYMIEHENKLELVFKGMDSDNDSEYSKQK